MTRDEAIRIVRVSDKAAQAVQSAASGDNFGAARHALAAVLEAIDGDVAEAHRLLDEAAIARANARADAAAREKFGDAG